MKKSKKYIEYENVEEFAKAYGLTDIDLAIIKEKSRIIKKLIKVREEKNISQAKLAKMLETKQPAIARMESGECSKVSFDFLFKAAMILEVNIAIRTPPNAA